MEQATRIATKSFINEDTLQIIEKSDVENAYKTMKRENIIKQHREKNKLGF